MLPNQRAIIHACLRLAKPKNSWVYVCQPTGTGKTSEMLEVGYLNALELLPKKGNDKVTVRLIVMTTELVNLHQKHYAAKMAEADPRVNFVW